MRMLLILIAAASLAVVALVAWRSVESRRAQQEDRLQKEHEEILEMLQRDVY
jgi:membrane protein implicated in regulation of membrane protease activity